MCCVVVKMEPYSNEEYADMHFMYGRANGNAREAARLYQETYPGRRHPESRTFTRVHQRLRENGCFAYGRAVGRPARITPEVEDMVLEAVQLSPGTSTRRIATQVPVLSHSSVWRILHRNLLYPYHLQRVQCLNDADFLPRVMFCQWMQQQAVVNPRFACNILFTDEAGFTRDGVFNYHNTHFWCEINPHAVHESPHQQRFSLNVWLGVLGDHLIGPHILPRKLNGRRYLRFLRRHLPGLLEDVPLEQRQNLWYMHDGAPAHFAAAVRRHLTRRYGQRWIGRGGPVPWPPRSPDLNPLDFCVWGHLKTEVYSTPVNTVEELEQRVVHACQEFRNDPGVFERIRHSLQRRTQYCIQMQGRHFEHLL